MNNLGFVKNTPRWTGLDWRQNFQPVCCCWEVKKAFNCVWHDDLLHKLLECCFPMVFIKLIWSFLTDRKFYVTVAGERPAECGVPSGVPQGAVLFPSFFNILTSDFPTLTDVQLALFPDDSVLYSTHVKVDVINNRLQYNQKILFYMED
jgi:hypothetical protein